MAARTRLESDLGQDDGFILLESIVSLSLIVIMLTALTTFFVQIADASTELRDKQNATIIASNTVDKIRVYAPTDIYAGHSSTLR